MQRLMMNGNGRTLLLIISLAFNLGACVAVAVQARGLDDEGSAKEGRRRHHGQMHKKLGLSPEQEAIVSASRKELFTELRWLRRELLAEGGRLADLLTAPELDKDAVSVQVERIADARNVIQVQMIKHLVNIRDVLEPGQLESFREFAGRVLTWSERGRSRPGRSHARQPSSQEAQPEERD